MASTYSSASGMQGNDLNTIKLLGRSRAVTGFFLPDYADQFGKHLQQLIGLMAQRKLEVEIDLVGEGDVQQIAKGVAHLQSGKNKGKVIVPLLPPSSRL
jgi:NADPH-dependent curcumin reductase CurA